MASPPRLAKWLLKVFSSRERDEGYLGDVEELYHDRGKESSPSRHGRLWYWIEVLRALPGFIGTSLLGRSAMAGSYLKIVHRNLVRHRSYSLINLFGLTLGITCCILILAYVGYELSYDGYHAQADQIFRVAARLTDMGQTREVTFSPAPVGSTMVQDYPEVLASVRFMPTVKRVFKFEDRVFFQERVFYADQSVFEVFSFEMTKGDPDTALEAPFTMVLTETMARKYFGDQDPVGRSVNWDNKFDYTVTGVVKDPPANSHFVFEVLASFATLIKYDARIGSWRSGSFATYLLLREGTDPEGLEQKMEAFDRKYLEPLLADSGRELESYLQPLKKIHLHSRLEFELGANSDIRVVQFLVGIAVIILLLACINFMNLSTARSARRAREVGLRKVLGALRARLVGQFLGESFVYAVLSMAGALLLARLLLPYFRVLAAREIPLNFLKIPNLLAGLAGVVIFVGLTAGSYPAFFLSAFKPISILRGNPIRESRGSRFRSVLVVFQFTVSIVLIIGTIVIFHQQRFMENKDLGFQKQNLLVIALQNAEARMGLESLKHEMLKIPGVKSAGASSMVPGEMYLFNVGTYPEGFPRDQSVLMDNLLVDH
ncbi:MAG: ABC transporter permease, partial [Candidatus Aminicenantaceae bacterium]